MTEKSHIVTIREIVNVKVLVKAEDPEAAIEKARSLYDPEPMFSQLSGPTHADSGAHKLNVSSDNRVEDVVVDSVDGVAIFLPKGGKLVNIKEDS